MQTRRTALLALAGATAASPLLAQTTEASPLEPIFFDKSDYAIVGRVSDLIIPRTETPGALDAHVPYRIDRQVNSTPELQQIFQAGLAALRKANFLTLSEAQQIETLQQMADTPFFRTIKNLTIDWYYRSEEGLVKELGYHGNTYRAEFTGCTHPEHWPAEKKSIETK